MIHKIIYFTPGGHELFMLVEATSYSVIERAVEFFIVMAQVTRHHVRSGMYTTANTQ